MLLECVVRAHALGTMVDPFKNSPTSTLDAKCAQLSRWGLWLRNFLPASVRVGYFEACHGACVALLACWSRACFRVGGQVVSATCGWCLRSGLVQFSYLECLLVPMAQPWPVLVGTVLSALVGAAAQALIVDTALACAVAVGFVCHADGAFALHAPTRGWICCLCGVGAHQWRGVSGLPDSF